jgi:CYTH domain-containing protein
MTLLDKSDPDRKTLRRLRQCFVWQSQYYALDTFTNVKKGVSILRIEAEQAPAIPSFLKVAREVTDDEGYSSYVLSKVTYYVSDQDRSFIAE